MFKLATGFLALSLVAAAPAFAQTAAPPAAAPQSTISNTVKPAVDKVEQKAIEAKDKVADTKATATKALIDINTATAIELAALKGIGPVRAEAIVKGRPYKGKDDLVSKKIIPEAVYNDVKELIIAKQK